MSYGLGGIHDEDEEDEDEEEDESDEILMLEPPLAIHSPFDELFGLGGDEVFELAALLLDPIKSFGLMFK